MPDTSAFRCPKSLKTVTTSFSHQWLRVTSVKDTSSTLSIQAATVPGIESKKTREGKINWESGLCSLKNRTKNHAAKKKNKNKKKNLEISSMETSRTITKMTRILQKMRTGINRCSPPKFKRLFIVQKLPISHRFSRQKKKEQETSIRLERRTPQCFLTHQYQHDSCFAEDKTYSVDFFSLNRTTPYDTAVPFLFFSLHHIWEAARKNSFLEPSKTVKVLFLLRCLLLAFHANRDLKKVIYIVHYAKKQKKISSQS